MTRNITICVGTVGSGAWTSTNGGESWRRVGRGLGNESRVYGLAVHPREPRTVFAGADDGIYKSVDGGQSFERLNSPMNKMDVWRIAFDPAEPRYDVRRHPAGGLVPLEAMAGATGSSCRSTWSRTARMSGCRGSPR